jgi:hypothetical protein
MVVSPDPGGDGGVADVSADATNPDPAPERVRHDDHRRHCHRGRADWRRVGTRHRDWSGIPREPTDRRRVAREPRERGDSDATERQQERDRPDERRKSVASVGSPS